MEIDILKIIIDLLFVWSGLIGVILAIFIAVTLCVTIFHFTLEKTFFKFWNWIKDDTSFGNWITKDAFLPKGLIFVVLASLFVFSKGAILAVIPLAWIWQVFFEESSGLKKLTSFLKKTGIALIVSSLIYFLLFDYSSFIDGTADSYIYRLIFVPLLVICVVRIVRFFRD